MLLYSSSITDIGVSFEQELEFSQSHISPYFVTSCQISKRSPSTVIYYPRYYDTKNVT